MPHIAWGQFTSDVWPQNDGTFYAYFDGECWSEPELIIEDPNDQIIEIDENNGKHILDREKTDYGSMLVYYFYDENWEGIIIDTCLNLIARPQILNKYNALYLVYGKSDTPAIAEIYFRKKDISGNPVSDNYINYLTATYYLHQNYPNPFSKNCGFSSDKNLTTMIEFSLKKSGYATLKIYNIKGQLIKILINEYKIIGDYSILWNGTNKDGKEVRSGIYLYRLQVDNHCITRSLTLIK